MKTKSLILFVLITVLAGPALANESHAYAEKFVEAVFQKRDADIAAPLVHPRASRQNYGGGSARAVVVGTLCDLPPKEVVIHQVIFFGSQDIQDLREKFPGTMWNHNRVQARLVDGGVGCLVSFRYGKRTNFMSFVVGQRDGRPWVTYIDT